jgi:dTDP-4-amino-4,6-dideoxygalactose transaminase
MNAKMSELQAAMGLSVLPYMKEIIAERQRVCAYYDEQLDFTKLSKLKLREHTEWNYAYYPVIFKSEDQLLKVMKHLAGQDIYPRRYFYPSLEELPYITSSTCLVAKDIAKRVLCLPLFTDLKEADMSQISSLINTSL